MITIEIGVNCDGTMFWNLCLALSVVMVFSIKFSLASLCVGINEFCLFEHVFGNEYHFILRSGD